MILAFPVQPTSSYYPDRNTHAQVEDLNDLTVNRPEETRSRNNVNNNLSPESNNKDKAQPQDTPLK